MYIVPQAAAGSVYAYSSPWHPYLPYRYATYPPYATGWVPFDPYAYPYYGGYAPAPFASWQRAEHMVEIKDYGKQPLVIDIEQVTEQNNTYRTAIWTGDHLQVTVMSIPVGDDIGLEVHPHTDQFIRIEEGQGLVQMGDSKDKLDFQATAEEGYAIMVPAGKWHNVTNTGDKPLKVYVIYAPPQHPFGTVHPTKADAMAAHE